MVGLRVTDNVQFVDNRWYPLEKWLKVTNIFALAFMFWIIYNFWMTLQQIIRWPIKKNIKHEGLNVILVIGKSCPLVDALLKELSEKYKTTVTIIDQTYPNTDETSPKVIFSGNRSITTQQDALQLWEFVTNNYGSVDVLILTGLESASSSHLNRLNNQLLLQFWIVMAFLPGMLERNRGKIVSVAVDRLSILINAGIIRTIFEDIQQRNTKVRVCLVEKNKFLDKILPTLPCRMLAKLISNVLDEDKSMVFIPSLIHYWMLLYDWLYLTFWRIFKWK